MAELQPYRLSDGATLRGYQSRASGFIVVNYGKDGTPVLVDMGMGKTIIVLTALRELIGWGYMKRPALIVAPLLVCNTVWAQEAASWSHTRKMLIQPLTGSPDQRAYRLDQRSHAYCINPENLEWLRKQIRKPLDEVFDFLVIDDVRLGERSKRFKQLTNHGDRHYLRDGAGNAVMDILTGQPMLVPPNRFKGSCYLTGTPTPTSLQNIWAPMFALDQGKRLHKDFKVFRDHFFYQERKVTEHVAKYMPKDGAGDRIHELIADVTVELNAEDYGVLPPVIGDATKGPIPDTHLHYIDLPPNVVDMYRRLEKEALVEIDKDVAMAANGGAKSLMCWQIANGFLYWTDEAGRQRVENIHERKLEKLVELVDQMQSNVLIPYHFKADCERIMKALKANGVDVVSLVRKNSDVVLPAWNQGKIQAMLIHPQSAGHGINIQFGGHSLIWFSPIWSADRYAQTLARLARSGQTGIVQNHHIAARRTVDELMLIALSERGDAQTRFRAAIRAYQLRHGLGIGAPEVAPRGLRDVLAPRVPQGLPAWL
jgi:predicted Fe-Mo cluster-binding NifX family protein